MDTQRSLDQVSEEFSISHTRILLLYLPNSRIYIDKLSDRYLAAKRSHYPQQRNTLTVKII